MCWKIITCLSEHETTNYLYTQCRVELGGTTANEGRLVEPNAPPPPLRARGVATYMRKSRA